VSLLLSHSADVNATTDESSDFNTPLLLAAAHGSNDALTQLIAAGANASVVNRLGLNVLHVAAASGNTFALHSIITHIKSTAAQSSQLQSLVAAASLYGDTPLHLCALSTHVPPLKALKCGLLLLQVKTFIAMLTTRLDRVSHSHLQPNPKPHPIRTSCSSRVTGWSVTQKPQQRRTFVDRPRGR
jgi:hypothetical protein